MCNNFKLQTCTKEFIILALSFVMTKCPSDNGKVQLTGLVVFMISCQLYGETLRVSIGELLQSIDDRFTIEEFVEEEIRVVQLICPCDFVNLTPSSICEEILTREGIKRKLNEELVQFVGNFTMFAMWKDALDTPVYDLTVIALMIFFELKNDRLGLVKVFKFMNSIFQDQKVCMAGLEKLRKKFLINIKSLSNQLDILSSLNKMEKYGLKDVLTKSKKYLEVGKEN